MLPLLIVNTKKAGVKVTHSPDYIIIFIYLEIQFHKMGVSDLAFSTHHKQNALSQGSLKNVGHLSRLQ